MIRDFEKKDIWPCTEIVRANWGDVPADRFWEEAQHAFLPGMKWPPAYFVYEEDDVVIGFSGIQHSWIMAGVADFIWVNVLPGHQGKGIGKLLTDARLDWAKRNDVAIVNVMTQEYAFFERFGFRINRVFEPRGVSHGWAHMSLQLRDLDIARD